MRHKIVGFALTIIFVALAIHCSSAQTLSSLQLKSPLPIGGISAATSQPMRFGFVAKPPAPAVTREIFAPFFISDESFTPTLVLQNLRIDVAITVRPALLVAEKEIPLAAVTLSPRSIINVPLKTPLAGLERAVHTGAVVVRYDFPSTGAISVVVQSDDTTHGLFLASLGNGIEEFMGTAFEGVFWAPDPDTEAFLALLNTSTAARTVQLTAFIDGQTIQFAKVVMAPFQSRVLRIDNLSRRSTHSGAGIRLEFEGTPGDIRAEGFLLKKNNGFSKRFQFVDTMQHFGTPGLRTNLFLLGKQPAADGFPAGISFRSIAVVRNLASLAITVTPTVKYTQDGSLHVFALKPITIGANRSTTIDFTKAQNEGALPAEFRQGTLELIPNIVQQPLNPPTIIAELFNFNDRTGGFVIGPSFTARASRGTNSIWRTDGSFQTVILVDNTANQEDDVTLTFADNNGATFSKTFPVAAGDLLRVSAKDLQISGVTDKDGNSLTGTYGTVSILGSHGRQSAIAIDRIIYSSNEADYLGYPASPCDYITNATPFLSGNNNPFTTEIEDDWSDGSATDTATPASGVSNATVAQLNGANVTFSPPSDGSSVDITFDFTGVSVGCGGCSTMTTFASFTVSGVRLADTFWQKPTQSAQGCFYASLACLPGTTPLCKQQGGVVFAPSGSCPAFLHNRTLVFGNTCFGPGIADAASGPGACN